MCRLQLGLHALTRKPSLGSRPQRGGERRRAGRPGTTHEAGGGPGVRITPAVIRDLSILSVLAANMPGPGAMRPELVVVHHTDCGMSRLAKPAIQEQVATRLGRYSGQESGDNRVVHPAQHQEVSGSCNQSASTTSSSTRGRLLRASGPYCRMVSMSPWSWSALQRCETHSAPHASTALCASLAC